MNKEEIENIEKIKKMLNFTTEGTSLRINNEVSKLLLKYIQILEQKEVILNKVTEFIKDDIKTNMENEATNTDGMKEYWRGCIDTEAEILEFIEGEKK